MGAEKAHQVLAVAIVFATLSWLTLFLRIWVRARIVKAFGLDDWAMVATQLIFTVYLICQLGGVAYGTGRHLSELEPWRAEKALMFWYMCEIMYCISTSVMKVAIGLLLLRIAVNPIHIWIIRLGIAASMALGVAFFFVLTFQCWPIHVFWTLNPTDGSCINSEVLSALTYAVSGLNVIADWVFGILPYFVVKDLQMPWKRKAMVAGILAFAGIGSAATVVRLPYVWTLKESALGWNGDFLYDTVGIAIWTTVEIGVGVTAGCIATLYPLVQIITGKLGIGTTKTGTDQKLATVRTIGGGRRSPGMPLDNLAPGQGVSTVISTRRQKLHHGGWRSQNSSEEELAKPDDITKHTVIEFDTDMPQSRSEARPASAFHFMQRRDMR